MDAPADKRRNDVGAPKAGFTQESGSADKDWRHRAACRPERLEAEGLDWRLWFPIGETGPALRQIEDAKDVCRRCPEDVVASCLEFALEKNLDGVWGETSEADRRVLKRRGQRARSRMA